MQDLRPAATVVLLREGDPGPEVFLLRRHGASGFMAGATVFPGGKVDVDDRLAPASGLDAQKCAQLLGIVDPDEARAFFVAAIRELHEESHVLLARDAQGNLPAAEAVAAIDRDLEALRTGHRLATRDWHAVVRAAGLTPALELLVPFAHWVTPRAEPRRFDTYFFVASHPPQQQAALDPHEATDARWLSPHAALHDHASGGEVLLPPPTLHTLDRLAQASTSVAQILNAWGQIGVGPRIEPWFQPDSPDGPVIVLPEDPLHPDGEAWRAEQGVAPRIHRFVLKAGRFTQVRG
jgi:8-oxo-dGTP pyrophosphatase MutT (NUDIX family)